MPDLHTTPPTTTPEESAPDHRHARPDLLTLVKTERAKILAENLAAKEERNARRWKLERDPVEYEKQKAEQRREYEETIRANEGREVRTYHKVPGETPAEREANRRKRKAARQRKGWANASQAAKDAKADRVWATRQRKRGKSEAEIEAGLEARRSGRERDRQNDYSENEDFGLF